MPDPPDNEHKNLKGELQKIAVRYLESYFGEGKLGFFGRSVWTLGGALTMLAFQFTFVNEDPVSVLFTGALPVHLMLMLALFVLAPFLLAIAVGQSIRFGKPLSYFLIGFLLYGFALTFVETEIEEISTAASDVAEG